MELRFRTPELRELDNLDVELVACSIWSDVRPFRGVAGLCDFRLAGRLSNLAKTGFLSGNWGDVWLLSARPKFVFERLLVFGAGRQADFDERRFAELIENMILSMQKLRVKFVALELPGRASQAIAPARAVQILKEISPGASFTLFENAAGRQQILDAESEAKRKRRQ